MAATEQQTRYRVEGMVVLAALPRLTLPYAACLGCRMSTYPLPLAP
jgi:hypothetical protein